MSTLITLRSVSNTTESLPVPKGCPLAMRVQKLTGEGKRAGFSGLSVYELAVRVQKLAVVDKGLGVCMIWRLCCGDVGRDKVEM